jgi:hypothetical protein
MVYRYIPTHFEHWLHLQHSSLASFIVWVRNMVSCFGGRRRLQVFIACTKCGVGEHLPGTGRGPLHNDEIRDLYTLITAVKSRRRRLPEHVACWVVQHSSEVRWKTSVFKDGNDYISLRRALLLAGLKLRYCYCLTGLISNMTLFNAGKNIVS